MEKKPISGKILTDETMREKSPHGSSDYPFSYYYEDIWLFDLHCVDWHWHPEVEFVYLKAGSAVLQAGGNQYDLTAGNGIFINSQVIHRFESGDHAIIPNIVFSPSLLAGEESLIYTKYVLPVIRSSVECEVFTSDVPWQNEMIELLLKVFDVQESGGDGEMETVQILLRLWEVLYRNMPATETDHSINSPRVHGQLQVMMQYIHSNYQEKITLEDIARSAGLSKSSVLKIFHDNICISPINYLIRYRLRRAAKLLRTTEDSVYKIALDTGFENTGYFCRKFKGLFGMTPSEYRRWDGGTSMAGKIIVMPDGNRRTRKGESQGD